MRKALSPITIFFIIACGIVSLLLIFFGGDRSQAAATGTPTAISSFTAPSTTELTYNGLQHKVFYDGAHWWAFYEKTATGTSTKLYYSYSTNLTTWTESSTILGGTPTIKGGSIGVYFDASTSVVLVPYYTTTDYESYLRGNVSGTSIVSWSANTGYIDTSAYSGTGDYSFTFAKDSTGRALFQGFDANANPKELISSNTISTSFADTGATWVNLSGSSAACYITDYLRQEAVIPLESNRKFVVIVDDVVSGNSLVGWYLYNNANCSGAAYDTPGIYSGAPVSRTNWGVTKFSNTDIRLVGQTATSTLGYYKMNVASDTWSSSTAPTWPAAGLASSSEIALQNDGTNLWAFVIQGDASNTIAYNVNSSGTWSGWTNITNTSAARSDIGLAQSIANDKLVLYWTEISGTTSTFMVDSINTTWNQNSYRFFANTNSSSVGSPLAGMNASATAPLQGTPFRLRLLLHAANMYANQSGEYFKLQYATSTPGGCTTSTGLTFSDVSTSTGNLQYYNNSGATDGGALASTSTDPTDSTYTIVNETYDKSNPFSAGVAPIGMNQDGKWDFSLVDVSSPAGTTYCLRVVKSDGTQLDSYNSLPEIHTEAAPTFSGITVNGNQSISLMMATTTLVQTTGTVSDLDGYGNIVSVGGTLYLSTSSPACVQNDNSCYIQTSCPLSGCSGQSCTATCSYNVQYFADPTDSGTPWAGQSWLGAMTATDVDGATTTATSSSGVTLLSLLALSVTPSINYGTLSPGSTTATLNQPVVVTSTGNVSLNVTLYGSAMTSGANSISVGGEAYATSQVAYASGSTLTVTPGVLFPLNEKKTTVSSTPATSTIYWGIKIPIPEPTGNYTGTNTFIGVENSLPWP
jgi:hypothetical protein